MVKLQAGHIPLSSILRQPKQGCSSSALSEGSTRVADPKLAIILSAPSPRTPLLQDEQLMVTKGAQEDPAVCKVTTSCDLII